MAATKSDPDLGLLEFQDIEGMLSYNCKVTLPISKKKVQIFFETNSEDNLPTLKQKKFLQYIVDNYNQVLLSIASELPSDIVFSGSDQFSFLQTNFDLDTLGIPLKTEGAPKWDLSLKNHLDRSMSILANFDNKLIQKIWVEKDPKRSLILRLLLKLMGV